MIDLILSVDTKNDNVRSTLLLTIIIKVKRKRFYFYLVSKNWVFFPFSITIDYNSLERKIYSYKVLPLFIVKL